MPVPRSSSHASSADDPRLRRSDRQHALVDVLRAAAERPVSVSRLARRFDVSARTIERDVRALQDGGVPIYGEPGRTGGYAICRDYSLPPLALTPEEALAAVAGLGLMTGSPFADAALSARDKILGTVPGELRERSRSLASRVAMLAPEEPTRDEVSETVRRVLLNPEVVRLRYRAPGSGEVTDRDVEPLGLIHVRANWILVGWCRLREAVRGFRTDGIEEIHRTGEPVPMRDPDPLEEDLARWDFLGMDR